MTSQRNLYQELCQVLQEFTECIVNENKVISSYDFEQIKAVLPIKQNISKRYEDLLEEFFHNNAPLALQDSEKENIIMLSSILSENMAENIKLIDYAIHYNQKIIQLFIDTGKKLKTKSYNQTGHETLADSSHVMSFDQTL
jgi:hypothetical protein